MDFWSNLNFTNGYYYVLFGTFIYTHTSEQWRIVTVETKYSFCLKEPIQYYQNESWTHLIVFVLAVKVIKTAQYSQSCKYVSFFVDFFFGSRTEFPLTHSHNLSTIIFFLNCENMSFSSMNNNNTTIIKRLLYIHALYIRLRCLAQTKRKHLYLLCSFTVYHLVVVNNLSLFRSVV